MRKGFLNGLLSMVDAGNNNLFVLLDLSATFNRTDHSLLLKRLHDEMFV